MAKLSDTALILLNKAATRDDRLAEPPNHTHVHALCEAMTCGSPRRFALPLRIWHTQHVK